MPQLDPVTFLDQVESFILIYICLYIIACWYILPKTYAGLKVRNRIISNLRSIKYDYFVENVYNAYISYTRKFCFKIKVNVEKYFKYKVFYIRYFSLVYLNTFIYILNKNFKYKITNVLEYYLFSTHKVMMYADNSHLQESSIFKGYNVSIQQAVAFFKPTQGKSHSKKKKRI